LGFDLKTLFTPAVTKWLEVTDAKTIEWVERAVHTDTLQPDNDELKQSSSAMDLFQFIGEAVEFLKKLEWPDELQNAKFATFLARVIFTQISC
jgi:MUN domain